MRTVRSGRGGRRRTTGLGAALLVHAGLFAAVFLPQAPQGRGLALADDQPGLTVSLVRLPSSAAPTPSPEQAELSRLESLRAALASPTAPADAEPAPTPAADASVLLQAFDWDHGISPKPAPPAAAPPPPRAAAGGSGDDPYARASVPSPESLAPRISDLWPQFKRCWRPQRAFPAVKLSVSLDARGGLAEPPSVVRDPAAKADPARLQAEAEAVRAVIACAPYAVAGGGPRSFEVAFEG